MQICFAVLVSARNVELLIHNNSHTDGAIAKRLCRGLQSRLDQFDSGSRLQFINAIQLLSSCREMKDLISMRPDQLMPYVLYNQNVFHRLISPLNPI